MGAGESNSRAPDPGALRALRRRLAVPESQDPAPGAQPPPAIPLSGCSRAWSLQQPAPIPERPPLLSSWKDPTCHV